MQRPPTTPSDGGSGAEWGQRRRGTAPPPRPFAADEERLRTEWDSVNAAWARARERDHAEGRQEGEQPPPAGPPPSGVGAMPDLSAIFVLLDTLRSAAPAELQERTTALIREILLTLRSLIDWYLERLDRPRGKPEVEDIPLD